VPVEERAVALAGTLEQQLAPEWPGTLSVFVTRSHGWPRREGLAATWWLQDGDDDWFEPYRCRGRLGPWRPTRTVDDAARRLEEHLLRVRAAAG